MCIIKNLIKLNPNDKDLGFQIRKDHRNDSLVKDIISITPNDFELGFLIRKTYR